LVKTGSNPARGTMETTSEYDRTPRYVCAVVRKPYRKPEDRAEHDRLRLSIALKQAAFVYPAEGRGRWNFAPLEYRTWRARTSEFEHLIGFERDASHTLDRDAQRARRAVRQARKKRRGYA
jgi:hypothetical protein